MKNLREPLETLRFAQGGIQVAERFLYLPPGYYGIKDKFNQGL